MKLEDKNTFLLRDVRFFFRGEAVVMMSFLPGRKKKSGSKNVSFAFEGVETNATRREVGKDKQRFTDHENNMDED